MPSPRGGDDKEPQVLKAIPPQSHPGRSGTSVNVRGQPSQGVGLGPTGSSQLLPISTGRLRDTTHLDPDEISFKFGGKQAKYINTKQISPNFCVQIMKIMKITCFAVRLSFRTRLILCGRVGSSGLG